MGKGKLAANFEPIPKSSKAEMSYDADYLSKNVRFTFRDCEVGGEYGADRVFCNRALLSSLFKRLAYFEEMTWETFQNISRENGWSAEKKQDPNHSMLSRRFPHHSTFGHIRVPTENKNFRLFCARKGDLVHILLCDPDGNINH